MAESLPINFQIPSETAIASYDFVDILNGVAYQSFYLYSGQDSSATRYGLTTDTGIGSYTLYGSYQTGVDIDYDSSTFTSPRTIKGEAIINFGYAGDGGSGNASIAITIRKVNGVTETDIGTITSPTIGINTDGTLLMKVTLPQTTIKVGEFLRVTLVGTNSGAGVLQIGHDPSNRTHSGPPITVTRSRVLIPFKITT